MRFRGAEMTSVKARDELLHRNGGQGMQFTEEMLEAQNDEKVEHLGRKVERIREISIGIGEEIKLSNQLLLDLDGKMASSNNLIQDTMKKLQKLSEIAGSRHMLFLILFCVFFFLLMYLYGRYFL